MIPSNDHIQGFSDYGQLFVDYSHLKAAAHPEELNQDGAEQGQQDQNMIDVGFKQFWRQKSFLSPYMEY